MTAPVPIEPGSPAALAPRPRVSRRLVLVALFAAVLALAVFQWSRQPTGWIAQQTPYSVRQQALVTVDGVTRCVQVTLSGSLHYQRSSAADAGDRHFRRVRVLQPTMEGRSSVSCTPGAASVKLARVHVAQIWTTTGGDAIGRRTATYSGPAATFTQYNSGFPLDAYRVTGKGKVCLVVTPSMTATADQVVVPTHQVAVCGH